MVNERLSDKEAKQYIDQRRQEVENLCTQKQLGYSDNNAGRWILLIIVLIVVSLVFLF
jgi:hypothetical protein